MLKKIGKYRELHFALEDNLGMEVDWGGSNRMNQGA